MEGRRLWHLWNIRRYDDRLTRWHLRRNIRRYDDRLTKIRGGRVRLIGHFRRPIGRTLSLDINRRSELRSGPGSQLLGVLLFLFLSRAYPVAIANQLLPGPAGSPIVATVR